MEHSYSLFDKHFSKFLLSRSELEKSLQEQFKQIVMRLTAAMEGGSSCLFLKEDEEALLLQSALVKKVERIGTIPETVLVIFDKKLYLQRYFSYEARLALQLKQLASQKKSYRLDSKLVDSLFPEDLDKGEINYQRLAAERALNSSFLIISGGPGTGKTTTTVRLLALLMHSVDEHLKLALCAPTGKAAQRLFESIIRGVTTLPEKQRLEARKWLPESAMTLHRLLGYNRNSFNFKHNRENPLHYDLIIVDEASMVDLAMMSKLVDALKAGCRLILLGDKDQLTSVESGTVLSAVLNGLYDNSVELQKTYRFKESIKELATAVKAGDQPEVDSLIDSFRADESWQKLVLENYSSYLLLAEQADVADLANLFVEFKSFMVLCSTRKGERGVEGINLLIENSLREQGLISMGEKWYSGRPVMVSRNDYELGLYNGDIGICLRDASGSFRVWFEDGESFKSYPIAPLHSCETVYGMTIHKSQGSEFDDVIVVLPQQENRVLSRELLYTAITRAKDNVKIVGDKSIIAMAVGRVSERGSGLTRMLTSL